MKLLFMIVIPMTVFSSCITATNVPEVVKKSFSEKFPNATHVKWGKESSTEYEAEFIEDVTKISANFSADGVWLETETSITIQALPEKIKSAILVAYPNDAIKAADKIDSAAYGACYEVEIKGNKDERELLVSIDGTILKTDTED